MIKSKHNLTVQSPCVQVCRVDGASGFCVGCWRSLKEIANWANYNDQERKDVIAAVEQRKASAQDSL